MYNVDRWWAYTKQNLHRQGIHVKHAAQWHGAFVDMTPAQHRRALKKARKRNDTSIGIH